MCGFGVARTSRSSRAVSEMRAGKPGRGRPGLDDRAGDRLALELLDSSRFETSPKSGIRTFPTANQAGRIARALSCAKIMLWTEPSPAE